MHRAATIVRKMETARTIVTNALISAVNPIRIMAHSLSGRVIWSPARKTLISVSSKERVSASTAPVTIAGIIWGRSTYRKVWKGLAPRSAEASVNGHRTRSLGVEHFGQTGTITDLYRHHGLDAQAIIKAAQAIVPGRPIRHLVQA